MRPVFQISHLITIAATLFGISAHAGICDGLLIGLTDRSYLSSIPDPGPVVSAMPEVMEKVRAIHANQD